MRTRLIPAILAVAMLMTWLASPARTEQTGERFLDLVKGGQPAATIVIPQDDSPVWSDAARFITAPAARWGGATPKVVSLGRDAALPPGDLVLIGTPGTHRVLADLSGDPASQVSRVPFTDQDGFAIESRTDGGAKRLIIAGRSTRGAYNGAVLCRDLLLDSTAAPPGKADVFLCGGSIRRSPQMAARGTYCLSIYGVAMKYTADDWKRIIDRFAEDGMNRICFWLSGHCPSKKYPQLFNVDATKGTKLTVEGVADLIRYCHQRGIDFYIGGGVFAWTASHYLINTYPDAAAVKASGLCPSNANARRGNTEHFLEMYQTWPEADGFMFEIRDEHGECQCDTCQKKLDEFGSKGYGKAEITWLQEFAREAWKLNPKLRFIWLIGYAEHTNDVYYYEQIRHMNDPRFEWLDTRVGLDGNGKWTLPGPGGTRRPFAFFSRQISHWDPFYRHRIEHLIHWAGRIADEGLYGYMPAFEPGFGSASYYGDEIPLPVNSLPYTLTGLTYREMTWNPATTLDQLKGRLHRRFFSPGVSRQFLEDMIYLQNFSFEQSEILVLFAKDRLGYSGETLPRPTVDGELKRVTAITDQAQRKAQAGPLLDRLRQLAGLPAHLERMTKIEAAMNQAAPTATPKTLEGFAVLRRMIEDSRTLYGKAVPDPSALASAIAALGG